MIGSLEDTIVAISTPTGVGGIAVVRVSGPDSLAIVQKMWQGKNLSKWGSHTAHLGKLIQSDGSLLDEVVATAFLAPNSFTGEDTVELSLHGSRWIQRQVVEELIAHGARAAEPGEFSCRAFKNGRMDLAQAEGIADLIAASSKAAHRLAASQMSGAFSRRLDSLRHQLIEFASLLELELDFSEEDVEFADRQRLTDLATETLTEVKRLAESYGAGRAFKEGIPVAIAGAPNAGKSTLLNLLLEDDKAIVSDIPGTTRDIIEDTREINGILFRFIDTAGLRHTDDTIEQLGIRRAEDRINRASIVLWLIDATLPLEPQVSKINEIILKIPQEICNILLINKTDVEEIQASEIIAKLGAPTRNTEKEMSILNIAAKTGKGCKALLDILHKTAISGHDIENDLIVTNARHHAALTDGAKALERAIDGLKTGLSADFIAQDVREAIHHLSLLTGAITTDTLLTTVFSSFCIGK